MINPEFCYSELNTPLPDHTRNVLMQMAQAKASREGQTERTTLVMLVTTKEQELSTKSNLTSLHPLSCYVNLNNLQNQRVEEPTAFLIIGIYDLTLSNVIMFNAI
jgi:hypothetical protein